MFQQTSSFNDKRRISLANLVSSHLDIKRNVSCNLKLITSLDVKNLRENNARLCTSNDTSLNLKMTSSSTTSSQKFNISGQRVRESFLSASKWSFDNTKDSETYGSIMNRIAEAVGDSETLFEYLKKVIDILFYTILAKILVSLIAILHVVQLSIGLKYLQDCPIEPNLSVYLFVGGCVGLLKSCHLLWNMWKKPDDFGNDNLRINENNEEQTFSKGSKFTDRLLSLFLIIWFVFGNYWFFKIYKPRFSPTFISPNNWCEKTVFMFSLFHICVYYSIFVLALLTFIFLTIFTRLPFLIRKFQEC